MGDLAVKKSLDRMQKAKQSSMGQRGIILKSQREIDLMRKAGHLVYQVHEEVRETVKPGITTAELNELAEKRIADAGATALFKGVVNPQARIAFPAALCISVNEEIVHGIPGDRVLNEGDIVSVDCGVRLEGYCGDAARTLAIGEIDENAQKLLDVTENTLKLAIEEMAPDRMWGEVASKMQEYVEQNGFSVVRDFVGHGIGQQMHEEPKVPNYHDRKQAKSDFRLRSNMTIAVEPMVNAGTHEVRYSDADRWVIVTRDGSWAAHFEHTLAMTDKGVVILTGP